jgi:hypothetical protein
MGRRAFGSLVEPISRCGGELLLLLLLLLSPTVFFASRLSRSAFTCKHLLVTYLDTSFLPCCSCTITLLTHRPQPWRAMTISRMSTWQASIQKSWRA